VILGVEGKDLSFKTIFENLKKNKWVWAIYIPLTIGINLVISLYPNCLFQLVVGLMTFGIPYYFGVRSVKTFLKAGVVIIIVTGIIFGSIYTFFLYNQIYVFEPNPLKNHDLEGGTVTPYLGEKSDPFNYSVIYTGSEEPGNITVFVNIIDFDGGFEKSIPLIHNNGTYYNVSFVEENIYYYNFTAYINSSETWIETGNGFGPITLPFSRAVGVQMFIGVGYLLLNGGLFFFIILGLYHWRRSSFQQQMRKREELQLEEEMKEKEEQEDEEEEDEEDEEEGGKEEEEKDKVDVAEEYECTDCGSSVPLNAKYCPACGEAFDED
jgi:hypothetical protein